MVLKNKGKKVLKNIDYDVFRQAFIEAIMSNIREKGVSGQDIQDIIKDTLDEKQFKSLVKKSLKNIANETDMTPEECKQILPVLMEEDVAKELDENLEGELHSEEKRNKRIYKKGEEQGLWSNIGSKRILGERPKMIPEIWKLIKTQRIIRYSLLLGSVFLIIATLLFKSIYKAITVGLTLTTYQGNGLIHLANILAGFGGVLLFFISFAIMVQFLISVKKKDDQLKRLADNYLRKTKELLVENNEKGQNQ